MKVKIILLLIIGLSIFLHVYKFNQVPACLNADEAAYGYNAQSILKTGKDEYGRALPVRLKSFGDYKLPLYSYVSLLFVATFGLSEESVRLPAAIVGILFPLVIFLLTKKLFEQEWVSYTAGFLTAVSPWFMLFSRQAHEGVLMMLFLCLSIVFLIKSLEKLSYKNVSLFSLFLLLGMFSYHIARIIAVFFVGYFIIFLWKKKQKLSTSISYVAIILIPLIIFFAIDLKASPNRLKSLVFYNTAGFNLKINELRGEHNVRFLHNKVTQSVLILSQEYLKYFSPQFLVGGETSNFRFGYPGISLITPVEYFFIFVGLYYLFKNKGKYRYLLVSLFLISPISAALAWQEYSVNRSLFMIVPIVIIASYGFVSLLKDFGGNRKKIIFGGISILFFFYLSLSWDFYFFHYMKRAQVIRSWECGNREMALYIKENYDTYDRFYITRKNGQPYMSILFYLQYPPEKYQTQAKLSAPDEFGFGQVEKFDKFEFNFKFDPNLKRSVFIGYPDDFNNTGVDMKRVKKIKVGTEEIFWIYET